MSGRTSGRRIFDVASTPIEGGITVVEASAGTGKTYCLVGLVLRMLLERRVPDIASVLLVTFTNAAADELAVRLRAALRDLFRIFDGTDDADDDSLDPLTATLLARHGGAARAESTEVLRRALLDFDRITVSTLHGFCHRVLDEAAFESGLAFDPQLVNADEVFLLDAARDVWRRLVFDPEAEPLLAGLAAARGWAPEGFTPDLERARRHPSTRVVPAPPLEEALDALRAARDALAASWSPGRVRHWLGTLPWKRAARQNDQATLAVAAVRRGQLADLDAFCAGAADAVGAALRFTTSELEALIEPVAHDEIRAHATVQACDAVARAASDVEHAVRAHLVREVAEVFDALKDRAAVLGFDDLLHRLDAALQRPRVGRRLRHAVRERWRAALIDEFQDTDLVQYRILRALFADSTSGGSATATPLILVGDPKQAIYRFRGADVFAYLAARRDAARVYDLERNWRSADRLVAAVNALFAGPQPFVVDEIPFHPVAAAERSASQRLVGDDGRALEWRWLGEESSSARAEATAARDAAGEVARLLEAGLELADPPHDGDEARPLAPRDVAVLVRTNEQATLIQAELRALGVPAVIGRAGDVFHTDEMAELERLLVAVLAPSDAGRLRAACATDLWGDDAAALRRLADDDVAWQRRVDAFESYRQSWREHGFPAAVRRLLDARNVRARLLARPGGERRLTNVFHAVELLDRAIHALRLSPAGLVAWLRAERALPRHDRDAAELRLESDAEAVTVATVHKAKGLEWQVVLCPFLWQAQPVDEAPVEAHLDLDRVVLDYGSRHFEAHRQLAESERLAEDLRLAYVALTRARRRVIVTWGAIGRGPRSAASALAYLLHRRQQTLSGSAVDEAAAGPRAAATRVASAIAEAADRSGAWRQDLARRVDAHADVMALRDLDDDPPPALAPYGDADRALTARSLPARLAALPRWRVASFTALTREAHDERAPGAQSADELALLAEHPEIADPSLPSDGLVAAGAFGEGVGEESADPDDRSPASLFVFARGARAGSCLHELFERVDYRAFDVQHVDEVGERLAIDSVIDAALQRHGLADPRAHRDAPTGWSPHSAARAMLERVLRAEVPDAGFRLADIDRAHRLVEWQFYAPLAARPSDLAEVFRRHAASPWATDYPERLERLGRSTLEGFLTGYLDLVVEHEGSWWIIDWKSNHLGPRPSDYGPDALARAMAAHDYVLQAHLYALALHRYLTNHLQGYDARRHFGGVAYVFLRGVAASTDTRSEPTGWWIERPSLELLEALDARLLVSAGGAE
ncbi:MAG: exodeoxyribonuclease V subunit beta [Acidobacteriota bacterium]